MLCRLISDEISPAAFFERKSPRTFYFTLPVFIKYPSCMAAKVATVHTIIELYFSSINDNVSGKRKHNAPVILFRKVCRAIIHLIFTAPEMRLIILISAIPAIQTHSHTGIPRTGSNLIRHTATNIKSASVSSFSPNALTVFIFLRMFRLAHLGRHFRALRYNSSSALSR